MRSDSRLAVDGHYRMSLVGAGRVGAGLVRSRIWKFY